MTGTATPTDQPITNAVLITREPTPPNIRRDICAECGEKHENLQATDPAEPFVFCPTCSRQYALKRVAEGHLVALMWPHFVAWCRHWEAAGLEQEHMETAVESALWYWHKDGMQARPGGLRAAIEEATGRPYQEPTDPDPDTSHQDTDQATSATPAEAKA